MPAAVSATLPARIFTVSELVGGVRGLLEDRIGLVWVTGEISNVHRAASGHVYMTLKDGGAQLRAALFRREAARVRFALEDGLEVLVQGQLTVYAQRGDLQIRVRSVEPRGQGALQLAFEQLRARLEREGLFAAEHKRPLPLLPKRLGVVTSPTGAAIQDVLRVTGDRFPGVPLLLSPTRVQGEDAEEEIVAALAALLRVPDVDVVLLVRGGGSLEDLQPFNTERVARAVRASRVPVVCGIGHEVDLTIACLAADAYAATPSAAAARALPDRAALRTRLDRDRRRLGLAALHRIERAAGRLERAAERLGRHAPAERVRVGRERLARLALQLPRLARGRVEAGRARLARAAGRLEALSPLAVLSRGYAIARRTRDAVVLRAASDAAPGETIEVRLAEGSLEAEVRARRTL